MTRISNQFTRLSNISFVYATINFLSLLLMLRSLVNCQGLGTTHEAQVAEGRVQYEIVSRESSRPKYGGCWTRALSNLHRGCRNLDDEVQSRLALDFTNCFLEKAGQKIYPCPFTESISSCLENVDSNAFTSYSNFFTHTQSMCYFLQSQVWQDNTEAAMESLTANSVKVSQALKDSHILQQNLAESQQQSLEFQRQLAQNGTFLARAIEASKGNVKEMLQEFKMSTFEQKTLIFEVFDRVSRLQNMVLSEVSWLYTVIFYSACLLAIYLVTATKRTADARLWMFVVLTANFAVERLVVKWSLPQSEEAEVMNNTQKLYDRVWMARQAAITIAIVILTVIAYRFKDYNKINNSLLEEIKRQNLELRRSMESFQLAGKSSMDSVDGGFIGSLSPSRHTVLSSHLMNLLDEDTGFVGDEENFSDDEEDDVLNMSDATDKSYVPGSREVSFTDEDFESVKNSRETTPVNIRGPDSALEALSSNLVTTSGGLISSSNTPVKMLQSQLHISVKDSNRSSTPIRETKTVTPRGSMTPSLVSPDLSLTSSPSSRYNLRRTPVRNEKYSWASTSSIIEQETPEAFARVVKKQQQITRRNTAKWKKAQRHLHEAEFSADEQ